MTTETWHLAKRQRMVPITMALDFTAEQGTVAWVRERRIITFSRHIIIIFFLIGGQLLPFLLYSKANQLYVYTYLLCLEPPTPFHSSRSSQSTSMSPLCYEPAPHELADLHMVWRRQWHPTPVLLPGKSHERRSLVGCSPWGH